MTSVRISPVAYRFHTPLVWGRWAKGSTLTICWNTFFVREEVDSGKNLLCICEEPRPIPPFISKERFVDEKLTEYMCGTIIFVIKAEIGG